MKRRISARKIASSDSMVECGRNTTLSRVIRAAWPAPPTASPTAPACSDTRARPSENTSCTRVGKNISSSVISVQYNGPPGSPSQPAINRSRVNGSTRERRRLSKIFQREIVEIGLRTLRRDSSGTELNSHCAICQSPRTQRCFRRV